LLDGNVSPDTVDSNRDEVLDSRLERRDEVLERMDFGHTPRPPEPQADTPETGLKQHGLKDIERDFGELCGPARSRELPQEPRRDPRSAITGSNACGSSGVSSASDAGAPALVGTGLDRANRCRAGRPPSGLRGRLRGRFGPLRLQRLQQLVRAETPARASPPDRHVGDSLVRPVGERGLIGNGEAGRTDH